MSIKVTTAIAPVIAGHHNVIDAKSDEKEWNRFVPVLNTDMDSHHPLHCLEGILAFVHNFSFPSQ